MRIAHVLRRLSFDDWGGTEQVVWNLAKAQKAAGHEVRLFATTALWKPLATKSTENTKPLCPLCSLWPKNRQYTETVDGLEIIRFRPIYPWWPMPKSLIAELDLKGGNPFVPGLGKALREWKPDVIHCHAMARIAELCLRTARQLTHSPTHNSQLSPKAVVSLHGGGANVPGEEAKSLKAPTRGRLPWGKMLDYALGWTRRVPEDFGGIVCVGEDEYERYRTRHPHVLFLPNGVDTSLFKGLRGHETRDERRVAASRLAPRVSRPTQSATHDPEPATRDPEPLTLLCVARIDRQKNQMALVEALARHSDATLRLVGPVTQPDYLEELKARAASLGVSDRVAFVGALKPGSPELVAEYARADAFALASRHEPFGIVVLEAWAAGLPVVASGVGGLGRLCAAHPDAAVTFAQDDAKSLDSALGELRRRFASGEARAMSDAGRRAAAEYDWRNLSARLVDFYAEI